MCLWKFVTFVNNINERIGLITTVFSRMSDRKNNIKIN